MTSQYISIMLLLLFSITIQATAAIMAIRLIGITGKRTAWGLIATALVLMAVRRIVPLYRLMTGDLSHPPDMMNELIGLSLSFVMAIGISRIAPLFMERKRREDELRNAAEEIEDLYENAPCGYHSLDRDGMFIRINATELQWLGYQRDEIVGKKRIIDLITARSRSVLDRKSVV